MGVYNYDLQGLKKPHKHDSKMPYFGTFDIETTTIKEEDKPYAFMYIWQYCIGTDKERDVYYGRTWKSFKSFVSALNTYYSHGNHIVTYVFNLGYEFQWLRSIFDIENMFAVNKRVPVRFVASNLEYRCAWKLTNMSLRKFLETEGVSHQKGTLDYSVLRYPDTPIEGSDLDYCISDVLGLHEALCSLILKSGFNLKNVPYTSTGFVRREAREAVKKNYVNHKIFYDMRMDSHQYKLTKAANRGGNTHANFVHSNQILKNVRSKDKVSSYPWVMLCEDRFPMSPWVKVNQPIDYERSHLLYIQLDNVQLKHGVYFPYIARAKCTGIAGAVCDNGRVVVADRLLFACTEIDYAIIERQYSFHLEIIEHYVAKRGYLPKEFRLLVKELFRGKCELKGVDEYLYQKYKNKFNALFGMMLTDITQSDIIYEGDEWGETFEPVKELLDRYYKSRNSFLSYQWGIYVTALARESLQKGLDAVGIDGVYCDTDSVKYLGDHENDFRVINDEIHALNMRSDIEPWLTVGGKYYELGLYEDDDYYAEFITMGAKKYAYKTDHGYGVTVSGLNKKKGAEYLEKNGGLAAFKPDTIFDVGIAGRVSAHYNDEVAYEKRSIYGHEIEYTSNVALVNTSYTLGISKDYHDFLKNYENYVDKD